MKYYPSIALLLIITIIIGGCANNANEMSADEQKAVEMIEAHGYRVISRVLEPSSYILDHEKLIAMPYNMYWSVQEADPGDYLGQEIVTIGYNVKHHPLDELYDSTTLIYVMLSNGEPIGGYAVPNVDDLTGWVYALDGRTLEEVRGMSYPEWVEEWKERWSPVIQPITG